MATRYTVHVGTLEDSRRGELRMSAMFADWADAEHFAREYVADADGNGVAVVMDGDTVRWAGRGAYNPATKGFDSVATFETTA